MGATPGRKAEQRLVDKTIYPQVLTYSPPPESTCDVPPVTHIGLTDTDRLIVRLVFYKGKVVDFAIMQVQVIDDQDVHIARIDCCRGIIHRHQYNRAGVDVWDHRPIVDIPHRDGWDVVDRGYADAYDVMFNEWEANLWRYSNE